MEWQAVVLVMQILMLAVGWFLFQQAKGELSARAAETPVLGEVKALQRSIKQLLADLENTSTRTSLHLEGKCRQAQELAATLANLIEIQEALPPHSLLLQETETTAVLPPLTIVTQQGGIANGSRRMRDAQENSSRYAVADEIPADITPTEVPVAISAWGKRRKQVFTLADAGQSSSAIARETGISEGEIETLLGLRLQRM